MIYDMHVHSAYSSDGKSTVKEYAEFISKGAVNGIGFAEHIDLMPECGSYGYIDFNRYLDEIRYWKSMGYPFHAGGEIDYNKKIENEITDHLKQYEYEYTICSVHMIDGISVSDRVTMPVVRDRNKLIQIMDKYYGETASGIKSGLFDVIGHIGVYRRYLGKGLLGDHRILSVLEQAEHEIARLCAASEIILEVNTSGLFSPLASTLPDAGFIRHYFSLGGRNVCAGSDAHEAGSTARGIRDTYDLLEKTGFDRITLPWDRNHPVRLDDAF